MRYTLLCSDVFPSSLTFSLTHILIAGGAIVTVSVTNSLYNSWLDITPNVSNPIEVIRYRPFYLVTRVCTSRFEQLTMEQLAVSNIQHPEVFDKGIATHVVTGILYGAEAFFVFDREVTHSDNYRDIHGNMEVFVKALLPSDKLARLHSLLHLWSQKKSCGTGIIPRPPLSCGYRDHAGSSIPKRALCYIESCPSTTSLYLSQC